MIFSSRVYLFVELVILATSCKGYFHTQSMLVYSPLHTKSNHSYFGYSVTYQASTKRLLIGAPKADINGKIFSCQIDNQICPYLNIKMDPARDVKYSYDHELLLGVSLSSGTNFSVGCATRYTKYFNYDSKENKIKSNNIFGNFGQCYFISDNSYSGSKMPSLSMSLSILDSWSPESATDAFGWSTFVRDNNDILVGSPPMSRGRVMYYKKPDEEPLPVIGNNYKLNYGYSITEVRLSNTQSLMAISTPYGDVGKGKVVLLSNTMDVLFQKEGVIEEFYGVGTLFGASLCAADINGNGIQELIVGAPAERFEEEQSDNGAIYIYKFTNSTPVFKNIHIIFGDKKTTGAYFGFSMVNVGDINNDGKEDVCIGAPYLDDGRGAVFLYSGKSLDIHGDGIPMQKIQAEGIMGLGFTLARVKDYNDNGCDEIAVGAPESDKVLLFRSIANIEVRVSSNFEIIQKLPSNATSFMFSSCFEVKFQPLPINVKATIGLTTNIMHRDSKIMHPNKGNAFYFERNLTNTIIDYCESFLISLPLDGDYSEVIQYKLDAELLDDPRNRTEFDPSRVILSTDSKLSDAGTIPAARGCLDKCIPKLEMTLITPQNNSKKLIETVEVIIINTGDTAYAPCVRIRIGGVFASKFPDSCEMKNHKSDFIYTCAPETALFNGNYWRVGPLHLELKDLTNLDKYINITVNLHDYCTNVADYQSENVIVGIESDSKNVNITSTSNHEDEIKVTNVDFNQNGLIQLEHTYTLINLGRTEWHNLKATLSLKPADYLPIAHYTVMINGRKKETVSGKFDVTFDLPILKKSNKIDVHIPFEIQAEEIENLLKLRNITLESKLRVSFDGDIKENSLTNSLYYEPAPKVPAWILAIASIFGILLLTIIGFILYECGFFGRKNKAKLLELMENHNLMLAETLVPFALASQSDQKLVDNEDMEVNDENEITENKSNEDF